MITIYARRIIGARHQGRWETLKSLAYSDQTRHRFHSQSGRRECSESGHPKCSQTSQPERFRIRQPGTLRPESWHGRERKFINVCFRVLNKRTDDLSMKRIYPAWTGLDGTEGPALVGGEEKLRTGGPSPRVRNAQRLQRGQVVLRQHDAARCEVLFQVCDGRRARNQDDVRRLAQQPRQ